jgi:tetratricopeptide (TPR) repeat protein
VDNSLSSLAALYRDQERYPEAERLLMLSMSIRDNILGKQNPKDPMLAAGLRELAVVRMAQGKFAESLPLLERSLLIEESFVGRTNPNLASTLINLGRVHFNLQNFEQAEQFLDRALQIQENSLGRQHSGLAPALSTLAEVFRQTGRDAEAETVDARVAGLRGN